MLEKDIENLLAKYPNEFFPNRHFKLNGQQVRMGSNYADIVFEDNGTKIIVEVKRGILKRGAIGQIAEYYGLLKDSEPDRDIHLILVANVIPHKLTVFLREKLGIDFLEVPASKIIQKANEHSYRFLDSLTPQMTHERIDIIKQITSDPTTRGQKVWIFQANPERYDIQNLLAEEDLTEDMWLVSRYKKQIKSGDIGLIWISGKEAGIYAVVDVIDDPKEMYDSEKYTKYWVDEADKHQKKLRVKMMYRLKLINNPVPREELKNTPGLQNLEILKQAQGTNFRVSEQEWPLILNLIKQRITPDT